MEKGERQETDDYFKDQLVKDIKSVEIEGWREEANNPDSWRNIVEEARIENTRSVE